MKKFRFIAVLLILLLVLSPVSVFAGEKEGITYTAIGDSIAFGIGGKIIGEFDVNDPSTCIGYGDLLSNHLQNIYGNVMFNDLSVSGLTSSSLRWVLQAAILNHNNSLGNIELEAQYAAISGASIITVSIGGGDLLDVVDDYDPLSGISFSGYLQSKQYDLLSAAQTFNENWTGSAGQPGIYQLINMINSDADVYVNTLYNAFSWDETLFAATDDFFNALNAPIITGAQSGLYEVVDVYTAFNEYNNKSSLINSKLSSEPKDGFLHPTKQGYNLIYKLCNDLMN